MKTNARFLRIVEVFPPSFSLDKAQEPEFGLKQKVRDLVEKVRRISRFTDYILVADVKDASKIKVSTLFTCYVIQNNSNVKSIPVITARDSNAVYIRSQILTALSMDFDAIMLVWGDKYKGEAANVYEYGSLSEIIGEARDISKRSGRNLTIMAPVNITLLASKEGLELARKRINEGADFLLAQPPTADFRALELHDSQLSEAGLKEKVLLNLFPFRDKEDVISCRKRFGWELSEELEKTAEKGEIELLKRAREIGERIKEMNYPGIYVSTRGRPELARFILE